MLLNVMDYASVQAAIDAAADGDRIYLPALRSKYRAPFGGGFKIKKSLEIFGDGPGANDDDTGTTIEPASSSDDVFQIDSTSLPIASVFIHDLKIKSSSPSTKGRYGITCVTGPHAIESIRIERVGVFDLGEDLAEHGFDFDGGTAYIGRVSIVASGARGCAGLGLLLEKVQHARVVNCNINGNLGGGALGIESGAAFYASGLDDNATDAGATRGQLGFSNCQIARVDACHFENFDKPGGDERRRIACDIDSSGGGAVLGGNSFGIRNPPAVDATGILVRASGNGPVTILPNRLKRVKNMVVVDSGAADCVVLPQLDDQRGPLDQGTITLPGPPNDGLIGSPTIRRLPATLPNAFAGLIVPSGPTDPTTGSLPGMLFYNTTLGLRVRKAAAWKTVKTV